MPGMLVLTVFFASLPWPWYSVFSIGPFTARPSIISAVPVILFFLWKTRFSLKPVNFRLVAILLAIYLIWFLPVIYNQHPHWPIAKLLSLITYTIIAYFAARLYLLLSLDRNWGMYWPIVSIVFLISCIMSYYYAFGTLVPNTNIATSKGFIHQNLYGGGVFSGPEAAKGIRHTMAIVPTLLLALIVHNKSHSLKINIGVSVVAVYLVLFSFSRSSWLAVFLIGLLVSRLAIKNLSKNILMISVFGVVCAIALPILSMLYPQQFSWVWSILGDRITDEQSTTGRLWVIGHIFSDSTFAEYLFGYNRAAQNSPHNMVLDALLQSGFLGSLGAIVIVVYAIRVYFRGLFKGDYENIVRAAFVAPALVRIFTAGSGMLHLADLIGLCVAANLGWYFRDQAKYTQIRLSK